MLLVEKWREPLTNPMAIELPEGIRINKILGYPHAGNDVFFIELQVKGDVKEAILKIERQIDADLKNEDIVIEKLRALKMTYVPQTIACGQHEDRHYIIYERSDGERLSNLISEMTDGEALLISTYHMKPYGRKLAEIHNLSIEHEKAARRKFMEVIDLPEAPVTLRHSVRKWLSDNEPHQKSYCFVHGDFHYANVLWQENEIKTVLDWELSGFGWREFDIAWAIILRPSQRFLKSEQEISLFLEGYGELSDYTNHHVIYAMVLIYLHFHLIAVKCKDTVYKAYVEQEIERLMMVKAAP